MHKLAKVILAGVLFFMAVNAMEVEINFDEVDDKDALPSAILKSVAEAGDLNLQGIAALDKGQFDLALATFEEALKKFPDLTDAENNIGVVHFRRGNVSQAQQIWSDISRKRPKYAIAWYNLGVIGFHDKEYASALVNLNEALKLNKNFIEALIMVGRINQTIGKKTDALASLKRAYELDPKNIAATTFYAYGLLLGGDTTSAETILEKSGDQLASAQLLGQLKLRRGDLAAATRYINLAIEKGADPQLWVELASALSDAHKCAEALTTMKKYFNKSPKPSADSWIISGIAAKECSDSVSNAQAFFTKGLSAYPDDPFLLYNLGQIYYYQRKYELAEQTWQKMADSMNDPVLYYLRAQSARRDKNMTLAESFIKKAIALDEKADYVDFLGTILYAQGKTKEAVEQFRQALKLDPESKSAQLNLAAITRSPAELEKALAAAKEELALCKTDCGPSALKVAILLFHLKRTSDAVATLEALPEVDKQEGVCRHLALFYQEQQEFGKAIALLEKAKSRFVLPQETQNQLADLYMQTGRFVQAIDALTDLLGTWSGNTWRIYYQLGWAWMQQNDFDRAIFNFQQSLKRKDNVAARSCIAFIYNRTGRSSEAKELWQKNLKDDPNNPALQINMGLLLESEGRFGEALDYYKRAEILSKGSDPAISINIGNAYSGLGRFEDAFKAYSQVFTVSLTRNVAAYNYFLLARRIGSLEKAQRAHALLQKNDPNSIYAKRVKAEMALLDNDTISALKQLDALSDKNDHDWQLLAQINAARGDSVKTDKALGNLPNDSLWTKEKKNIRADLAFVLGDFNKAYMLWESTNDTAFATRYNMALAAFNAKKFDEALRLGKEIAALSSSVDKSDLYRMIGNAAFGLKQYETARQYYLQLSNIKAQDPVVQYNLAVASYNLGQVEAAWNYYQLARKLNPAISNADIEKRYASINKGKAAGENAIDELDSMYNEGVTLQDAGKDKEAQVVYRSILTRDSLYSRAWNNLGAVFLFGGNLDSAQYYFYKAIEKKKDLPEAYVNLVHLCVAKDQIMDARRWLMKGQVYHPDDELLKEAKVFMDSVVAARKKKQ